MAVRPTDSLAPVGLNADLPGASTAQLNGDPDRIEADLRRAVRGYGGAIVSLERDDATGLVRAEALLPTGRRAMVYAAPSGPARITLVLRVGRFGDAKREAELAGLLQEFLGGPPKPQRDASFELPRVPGAE